MEFIDMEFFLNYTREAFGLCEYMMRVIKILGINKSTKNIIIKKGILSSFYSVHYVQFKKYLHRTMWKNLN
jgi:hypothetical protein